MKLSLQVCEVCRQDLGRVYREYEHSGKLLVFCSLTCWRDFWTLNWAQWQEEHFSSQQFCNVTQMGKVIKSSQSGRKL